METNTEYQRILQSYLQTLHSLQTEQEAAIQRLQSMLNGAPEDDPDYQDIRAIEQELDIIRGKVATPKGYRIDKKRIKSLQIRYNRLKGLA